VEMGTNPSDSEPCQRQMGNVVTPVPLMGSASGQWYGGKGSCLECAWDQKLCTFKGKVFVL